MTTISHDPSQLSTKKWEIMVVLFWIHNLASEVLLDAEKKLNQVLNIV